MKSRSLFLIFTIVVLVTSAIFVLLALIPIVANDKEGAKLAARTTLSNAKQLSIALMAYATDYDDHLPLAENWEDALDPYVKNSGVFFTLQSDGSRTRFAFSRSCQV